MWTSSILDIDIVFFPCLFQFQIAKMLQSIHLKCLFYNMFYKLVFVPGSAERFFLLKGSLSSPQLLHACSVWRIAVKPTTQRRRLSTVTTCSFRSECCSQWLNAICWVSFDRKLLIWLECMYYWTERTCNVAWDEICCESVLYR